MSENNSTSKMKLPSRESLEAFWMPYTANRYFKDNPLIVTSAEGCYLTTQEGNTVFDGLSGLWCCGMGHGRPEIIEAVSAGIRQLDFSPTFQVGNNLAFQVANKVKEITPQGLDYVFFTNSGSEAADTALKMARAYWRQKGQGTKTRFIGRARGYHGVNYGGMSVGGIGANRKLYGQGIEADHLPHTCLPENRFSKGIPEHGIGLADALEDLVALHDASNIAAVIVEPMSGSGGVVIPPNGYLNKIREICTKHDILLIFDEVITGFGRTGHAFGADAFGVTPDIMTLAKGLTNGCVPMGAVVSSSEIYQTFMQQGGPEYNVEFPHGYTYSGHPVACAAALAAMDIFQKDNIAQKAAHLATYFEQQIHQLKGLKHIVDIRNFGLAGAIEIGTFGNEPAKRPFEIFRRCWQAGMFVRCGGNTIQLAPPFISTKEQIDELFNVLSDAIIATD
ncbi:MAG: beta-alanine--pyruvate transaminase [Paraglaciecola sp.]|jgi:beta-alanine--pyruvate transaminase